MAETNTGTPSEAVDAWRLWVFRYEQQRLAGRSHPEDRLTFAVMRQLEANLLDPSHRGAEAVATAEATKQAAIDLVGFTYPNPATG
jgi:hypothetical protein